MATKRRKKGKNGPMSPTHCPNHSENAIGDIDKKSRRYTYKLLVMIKNGAYAAQISRQLKEPESTIKSRLKSLERRHMIAVDFKSCFKVYKLTAKGYRVLKSLSFYYSDENSRHLRQSNARAHKLSILCPIVKDNPNARFEKINKRFSNWMPQYCRVTFPVGLTFLKTPKNIIIKFHEFESEGRTYLTDFLGHVLKGCFYAARFLKDKYGIEIDIPEKITDQHLVNEAPEYSERIDDKMTTEIDLNRETKSLLVTKGKAKAWIDRSKGMPEIETNDLLYEEKLLMMPENVDRMAGEFMAALDDFRKEIRLHLEATREWKDTAKEIRNAIRSLKPHGR